MKKLIGNERFQKMVGGGILERMYLNTLSRLQLAALGGHKNADTVKLLKYTRRKRQSLQTAYEQFLVHSFSSGCAGLPGAMAEVGVFQGCSARILCETRGDKNLYLFDTFEGLPEEAEADRKVHKKGQYAASLESVQDFLKDFPGVRFYKGLFPDSLESGPPIEDDTFCFAHFDVDLYEGTLACLEYFYPRMTPCGIMLSHDYSILAGVKQAFTEFFKDKPERVIELPSTQCMVVKQLG